MDEWLATLPLVAIGVAGSIVGVRIRNRIDAATFRLWVKRALFAIALVLLGQYAFTRFA
jgi:uncharacterized membrane protein YfcA